MAAKRIETQLSIKAIDQYSSVLKGMRTVTGRFADGVRTQMTGLQNLRGPLKMIEDFRKQQDVVRRSGQTLDAAREKQRRLLAEIRATSRPTAQMRREFDRARAATERLEQQHGQHRRTLAGLRGQLRNAGVNTGDLAGEQRRLAGAIDGATTAFGRQIDRLKRIETMQSRIAGARERMDRDLATAANLNFAGMASMQTGRRILTGLSGPVQEAIEFESAMSDVRKVVDFDTPEAFKQMSDDILELSTRIPMAADGLAQIVAAGGQSGFANDELLEFAEMAAKIGVAFDISADDAGTSMAQIRTAMKLSLEDTGALFDAMNHISNDSAATAEKSLNFMNRVGADGARFGFSGTETLAIGSAMIAAGGGAETAATSFRNMGRALTRGESATNRQSAAMQRLGLDSEQVAREMQNDAVGTTMDVLQRLRELPEHIQASVMSDLFGDEARELGKLLNNAELLPNILAMVADERDYLGSAEREYAVRAESTANNIQLMRNQMSRLGVSIGEVVLPPLNDLLEMSQGVIERVVDWTKAHPNLTKWLVIGAAAVGGLAVAGGVLLTAAGALIGTMAVLRFGLVGLGARAAFAAGDLMGIGGAFRGLRRLPKFALSTLIKGVAWTARLLPPVPWARLAGGLKWSSLIKPLSWLGRGALRFIPVIGWASLAGALAWHLLIKPLGWDKYLPSIDWGRVWGAFSWEGWLPEVNWSNFIGAINWPQWVGNVNWSSLVPAWNWKMIIPVVGWVEWFGFQWSDFLPKWNWNALIPNINLGNFISLPSWAGGSDAPSTGSDSRRNDRKPRPEVTDGPALESLPAKQRVAAETIVSVTQSGQLPTPTRLQGLRDNAASLREEIAGIQGEIDNLGKGPMAETMAMPLRQAMDARRTDLQKVEAELSNAEGRAGDLTAALQVIHGTGVAPEIGTASIERANDLIAQMAANLRAASGADVAAMVAPQPVAVDTPVFDRLPAAERAAAETVVSVTESGPLPTPARLQELRDYAANLREEIAGIQGDIDNLGQGPMADSMALPMRQDMEARRRELQQVETELTTAEGRAGELTNALQVLNGTEAAPEISTASIDRANEKVARLLSQLRAVPSTGTGATSTSPRDARTSTIAGARAFGGPVRMGLPYLVNENTPRSEVFVPSQSGGILNVGQAQSVFRSYLSEVSGGMSPNPNLARLNRGAQGLRAASLAVLTSSALAAPAAAQPMQAAKPGAGAVTVQIENFTVHVPSGVSDPDAIADIVSDRIGQRVAATLSASFSD